MSDAPPIQAEKLESLIADVMASGGAEMANAQPFVMRLTEALGLPQPDFAREENRFNDYVFERAVAFKHPDGSSTTGRIDCYKRDCFILEAKQSAKRKKADPAQTELLPADAATRKPGHAKQGTRAWDKVMAAARKQAEDYARALPVDHGYPPFLMIVDVGNVIEIYADFSGQGKNYAQFPDRQSYRLSMEDLREPEIQAWLRAIWSDPLSLDPAKKSAEVTRDIAERLAKIARRLEGKHDAKDVAEFLMRCLFTMFAEDVGLLPEKSFEKLLFDLKDRPDQFVPAMEYLWKVMNEGGYEPRMMAPLKKFNGGLFAQSRALPLDADGISELYIASKRDWRDVEPAIFGTLLERALDPRERSKLGAHYTPRAYVERLVIPTIIEPLRADWEVAQSATQDLLSKGDERGALRTIQAFHRQICTTRVLDPACGTGNFLYVSLELMKRLEGEVLQMIAELGGQPSRYVDHPEEAGIGAIGQRLARTGGRFTVDPHQFYGLELNPRAVPIADLVLWIGYIKNQVKTSGVDSIQAPVLDAYGTIRHQDAILAYDSQELLRDEHGRPMSRWDGVTKKLHPITGEEIPDPDAKIELYTYANPRPAAWPEVEFIVGNPPFIGNKRMRSELGDGYAEAVWKARPKMPGGADFVMHFWDEAAERLSRKGTAKQPNPLRRFGFITTNSITQTFSRRVIEKHLASKEPVSLLFAISDHPWMKASDKAAVRIAMTVAAKGAREGVLATVRREAGLNTDAPQVELDKRAGKITAKLTLGTDLSLAKPLVGNESISGDGVTAVGKGFELTPLEARNRRMEINNGILRPYKNGRDLNGRDRDILAIDATGYEKLDLQEHYPSEYQWLYDHVRPQRESNPIEHRREKWWLFGANATSLREALVGIERYLVTADTSKHRVFQFLDINTVCNDTIVAVAVSDYSLAAVVASRIHVNWSISSGGWLGVGNDPRYNKTRTFDPFPFPPCVTDESNPALRDRLAELGERLDGFRKQRLAEHEFLTMTGMYNVLERIRELEWMGREAGAGTSISPLAGEMPDRAEGGVDPGSVFGASPPSVASRHLPRKGGDQGRAAGLDPSFGPRRKGGDQRPPVPPLTEAERDIHEAGLISVLKDIHDEIDRAVFEAYGWSDLGERLIGRPGATMPSPHKSADQELAEEELLTRLVALNVERQAEEARGQVRWLRPDYQIPKLGHKVARPDEMRQDEAELIIVPASDKPKWPKDAFEQVRLVKDVLSMAPAPARPDEIEAAFDGRSSAKRKARVDEVLRLLTETGGARAAGSDPEPRYFVAR
ncbi:DNA methyltransferase [uncultured Hoeflea sp.]|uniref:class I SAM-dependent DNA methyltransferase n=1 Tax=uncultured Hoeflea sp. TaxID=538666 RepID=UPI00261261FB|nr:DNA methyltransferase [uncultured Hoeflea sp.]